VRFFNINKGEIMSNKKHWLAVAALACSVAAPSMAAVGLSPVIGVAYTAGGKTLVGIEYSNGSVDRVKSGGQMDVFAGVEYRETADAPLTLQATVGYHFDRTSADNGSVTFSRVPFEVLGFWNVDPQFRVGVGLRKATNAKFRTTGQATYFLPDFNMRSTVGFVVQADYFFAPQASVYFRLVGERYKSSELVGGSVSGNHFGVGLAYHF